MVFDQTVSIELNRPGIEQLPDAVHALREWQRDGEAVPLHPGDVGWFWRFGPEATAAAIRTWSRDGQLLAVGLLDGPGLRLAVAPDVQRDEELARRVVADVTEPERGVLPPGPTYLEARFGGPLQDRFIAEGWHIDKPWTPLIRDLTEPVPDCGVRIEAIGPERAGVHVAVVRAAFDESTFTEGRWRAMADGAPYADARSLVAYDDDQVVAAATVWSAGPGRPGLLEPVGVHPDHRGHGYGTAISVAAAAVLRELGSSSASVCTETSNVRAVATYRSAGFEELPPWPDLGRSA